jgi:hypothetical protein
MDCRLLILPVLGFVLLMPLAVPPELYAAGPQAAAKEGQPSACPALKEPFDKEASALKIITESPIPGLKKLRSEPTAAEAKCAETLRAAGKKAIEKKKLVEGVSRYLAAVKVAPAQAEATYQELASMLDTRAYGKQALAVYFKSWNVMEAEYNYPDAKLDGHAVLGLADIRDSIVRLGGQVPSPTSEVGRTVAANTTRHLREQYFNADPLLRPDKSPPAQP